MFKQFRDKGLCVVPLRKGIPLVEWSRYFEELPGDEINQWSSEEYALVCGKVSGVIGLDIDIDGEEGERIYQLAGATPVRKQGSKGFTAFYRYSGENSTSWKRKDDTSPIVELLSHKRLTTIPPSPHRKTGEPYIWMDKKGLLDTDSLPTLPADFNKLMDALYPRPARKVKPISYNLSEFEKIELADAEDMLDYINPDCTRDEWVAIGMALRDEFGDAACDLWHRWSRKAGSRYDHSAAQSAWRSFTNDGYTIGTIIHQAKQNGWVALTKSEDASFMVDLSYLKALEEKKKPEPLKVHGLVGEIAEWITASAIRPQPVLSLAAALTFVGMLKGHAIEGRTGLRTNLLTMSLAPTGGGKEHPQACLRKLIRECELDQQLMGEPTSGTGFLRALHDRGRVTLWVMDEMGRFLSNTSHRNAGTHQREIIDYIIKTFSCANSVLKGREYADSKKNPTIDIIEPHFCCLGSTVLERFKDACSSSEVVDGFLNRWLVMATHSRSERQAYDKSKKEPPAWLIAKIRETASQRKYEPYSGASLPVIVKFTPESWDIFEKYRDDMDKMIGEAQYPLSALYARCAEHVEKVALTISDGDIIGMKDVEAAIKVVEYSNSCIMDFAGLLSDNEAQAEYVKVREIVRDAKTISKSELTRKTQFLKRMRRVEIMNDLAESGDVMIEKVGDSTYFTAPNNVLPINKNQ